MRIPSGSVALCIALVLVFAATMVQWSFRFDESEILDVLLATAAAVVRSKPTAMLIRGTAQSLERLGLLASLSSNASLMYSSTDVALNLSLSEVASMINNGTASNYRRSPIRNSNYPSTMFLHVSDSVLLSLLTTAPSQSARQQQRWSDWWLEQSTAIIARQLSSRGFYYVRTDDLCSGLLPYDASSTSRVFYRGNCTSCAFVYASLTVNVSGAPLSTVTNELARGPLHWDSNFSAVQTKTCRTYSSRKVCAIPPSPSNKYEFSAPRIATVAQPTKLTMASDCFGLWVEVLQTTLFHSSNSSSTPVPVAMIAEPAAVGPYVASLADLIPPKWSAVVTTAYAIVPVIGSPVLAFTASMPGTLCRSNGNNSVCVATRETIDIVWPEMSIALNAIDASTTSGNAFNLTGGIEPTWAGSLLVAAFPVIEGTASIVMYTTRDLLLLDLNSDLVNTRNIVIGISSGFAAMSLALAIATLFIVGRGRRILETMCLEVLQVVIDERIKNSSQGTAPMSPATRKASASFVKDLLGMALLSAVDDPDNGVRTAKPQGPNHITKIGSRSATDDVRSQSHVGRQQRSRASVRPMHLSITDTTATATRTGRVAIANSAASQHSQQQPAVPWDVLLARRFKETNAMLEAAEHIRRTIRAAVVYLPVASLMRLQEEEKLRLLQREADETRAVAESVPFRVVDTVLAAVRHTRDAFWELLQPRKSAPAPEETVHVPAELVGSGEDNYQFSIRVDKEGMVNISSPPSPPPPVKALPSLMGARDDAEVVEAAFVMFDLGPCVLDDRVTLDAYLTLMQEVISVCRACGGCADTITSSCITASFNVHAKLEGFAERALMCAADVCRKVETLIDRWMYEDEHLGLTQLAQEYVVIVDAGPTMARHHFKYGTEPHRTVVVHSPPLNRLQLLVPYLRRRRVICSTTEWVIRCLPQSDSAGPTPHLMIDALIMPSDSRSDKMQRICIFGTEITLNLDPMQHLLEKRTVAAAFPLLCEGRYEEAHEIVKRYPPEFLQGAATLSQLREMLLATLKKPEGERTPYGPRYTRSIQWGGFFPLHQSAHDV